LGVARPARLIEPNGLVIATDVVPVITPAPVMPPVPVAVRVIAVPLSAAPMLKGLFAPVLISASVPPVALMELVVAMPPAAESVRLKPPRPAVDAPLLVRATESVKVTPIAAVPTVWVVVILGVANPDRLIEPRGLVIATAVVPVIVPAPVMPPVPVAVKLMVVPLSAPPMLKGLFPPELINASGPPVALMEPVVVIPPAALSVRLKPPSPAVEAPLPVSATESVNATPMAAVPTV
jgi:hypothetical protein